MFLRAISISGFAALLLSMSPAFAQSNRAIGDLAQVQRGVTITGRVTEVFGNKFILDDGTGRVLVESGPHWFHRIEVSPGETVTVLGEAEGGTFDAFEIRHAHDRVQRIRPLQGPPPWAGRDRR